MLTSRYVPSSEQKTKGLPLPSSNGLRQPVALIRYLSGEKSDNSEWLIGFLPYFQALKIAQDKTGEVYWTIELSVPSNDVLQDIEMLWYLFEQSKHPTLPRVYCLDSFNLGILFSWVESAHHTIEGSDYQKIAQLEEDLGVARKAIKAAEKIELKLREQIETLQSKNIGLKEDIKALNTEIKRLSKAPRQESGYVYLLKMVNGEYWKIGRTKTPNKRISTFDVKLPFPVECEHLIETKNMYTLESELHKKFASKRVQGEWFLLAQEDIDYIKSL